MDVLIIGNQTARAANERILHAWKTGKAEPAARLDFANIEDGWKLLSEKRRGILQQMAGGGALSIREIARRAGRDVRAVHSDIRLLHQSGVIDKTADGKMILPYKTIKFDFTFIASQAA